MENIFNELIRIERQAASEWDKLALLKAGLPRRIQDEVTRRGEIINKETEKAIQTIAQTIKNETDSSVNKIKENMNQTLLEMEAKFAKHHDYWLETIISCILKA
jgi:polyhydroxyalkanoate synthesis regulator phasin